MPRQSPTVRRLSARAAALERWSRLDPDERTKATAPAREAFLARFADEPDPEAALRAHMLRLVTKRHRKAAQ